MFVWVITLAMSPVVWGAPHDVTVLREQSREIIKVISCGGCHTPDLSTTKRNALEVYNLAAPFWTASMTDRQLLDFLRRLKTQETIEEMRESGIDPTRGSASKEQIRIVSSFIDKEMQNRKLDPTTRFRQLQETQFPEFHSLFSPGTTMNFQTR
jgi:hypothetical protein